MHDYGEQLTRKHFASSDERLAIKPSRAQMTSSRPQTVKSFFMALYSNISGHLSKQVVWGKLWKSLAVRK